MNSVTFTKKISENQINCALHVYRYTYVHKKVYIVLFSELPLSSKNTVVFNHQAKDDTTK